MPVENSGNVASFTFNSSFRRNVPAEYVEKPLESDTRYLMLIRMIQSVKEALHHNEDLDKVKIIGEVKNMSRGSKPVSKRLFFNKELLTLGNLEFAVGDEIKVSFQIQRVSSQGDIVTVPFQETDFIMTAEGLAPSVEQPGRGAESQLTPLQTWVAKELTVPFNFSKET